MRPVSAIAAILIACAPCVAGARALVGVALSGPELNANTLPGKAGTDYVYPDAETMRHFAALGATAIRLPVLWERLQPALGGKLAVDEVARLDQAVGEAHANGLRLIVDIHDYGRWRGRVVGGDISAADFGAFWSALAAHLAHLQGGKDVVFGLMNEPHDMDARSWMTAEQTAIDAIRDTGARNLILASGADWDGAHSVVADGNAALLQTLHDPAGNLAIELHQYLDGNSSGTSAECAQPAAAAARLQPATNWLRAAHLHGFLGEFAAARSPACLASLDALMTVLDKNRDVWIGWTYWAAGPWWGDYMFSVQPKNGQDAPQTGVLVRHMGAGS